MKKSEDVKFILRCPADIHKALVAKAKADDRSLNSYIIQLLRKAAAKNKSALN